MSAVAFDTLKFARNLREKAQLSPEQAEGFADVIAEALASDLATKADVETLRLGLRADLAETRAEIVRWVAGLIGFQTLAIIGAVIALAKTLH